jgi:hypothetical protein
VQTLLAYATSGTDPHRFVEGAARVGAHYGRLAGGLLAHEFAEVGSRGLHVWEAHAEQRRWPMWQRERQFTVATLHTPINYERIVGELPPEQAPLPLAQRLLAEPASVLQLGAPFVLATVDPAELVLLTDAFGLGRLFELQLSDGWVWTNRPTAAYLFAGLEIRPDRRGWHYHAASDWFMDDSTPFDDLSAVGPATCIRVGADGSPRVSHLDPVRHWLNEPVDPLHPETLDRVADSLQRTARSAARLWIGTPQMGLSGGRDSRVVTAAFLTAGVDVDLHTNANPEGEAEIARQLLDRWGKEVEHEVRQIASTAAPIRHKVGGVDRALGWMRYSEGLHPASYLPRVPPWTHARTARLLVSGAAGELAHGHYYPADLEEVEALPAEEQLQACAQRLKRRLIAKRGPNHEARAAAGARIDDVLGSAAAVDAEPLVTLDVFYLLERLRRWGTAADQTNTLIPLLTPEFVQAALRLSPRQRKENALHRALIALMIPAWEEVPFYSDARAQPSPPRVRAPRLWEVDVQRELMAALVDNPQPWSDAFAVPQVHEIWHKAMAGGATSVEESVLQRVIWRTAFEEYAAEVNGRPLARPAPIQVTEVGKRASAPSVQLITARWKGRLRRQPAIRRAAHTRLGRRLRKLTRRAGGA